MKPKLIEHGNAEPSLAVMSGRCREQAEDHDIMVMAGKPPTSATHPVFGRSRSRQLIGKAPRATRLAEIPVVRPDANPGPTSVLSIHRVKTCSDTPKKFGEQRIKSFCITDDNSEANTTLPEIDLQLTMAPVTARTNKLRARWSQKIEAPRCCKAA